VEILNDLRYFYTDLNKLIIAYDTPSFWETKATTSWKSKEATGFLNFQNLFYICLSYSDRVLTCNTNGDT